MNDSFSSLSRRTFLHQSGVNLGAIALGGLLGRESSAASALQDEISHFAPRAKRVIFLTQSGGPSQLELFDHKPSLKKWAGKELPDSIRQGQRLTTMTRNQKQLILPGITKFDRTARAVPLSANGCPTPHRLPTTSAL